MATLERSIEIEVPVRVAYDQWTQFEDFPLYMESIESVTQRDDRSQRWRANIGGSHLEWTAEIYDQQPDHHISWRARDGVVHEGTVRFESLGERRTRATVRIEYKPRGFVQSLGDALGLVTRRIDGDLQHFKRFIESRGQETGGWRGEIHGDSVRPQPRV